MHYLVQEMPRTIGSRIWPTIIAPRPVFLIVSRSEEGLANIAPFNSISIVASYPPVVSISFGMRHGEPKHTQVNILSTRKFSLNVVPKSLSETANTAATGTDRVDDFLRLGLTPLPFKDSAIFGVAESAASIACEVTASMPVEGTKCHLILAKCVEVHIDENYLQDGLLDPSAAELIASIGIEDYITVKGEAFSMPRLWE